MRGIIVSLLNFILGPPGRQRLRVSQSLLGVPSLLLMQGVVLADRLQTGRSVEPVQIYCVLSLSGCAIFYALLRCAWSERLSGEASLSRPQMMFAMVCVAWAYLLAGPLRAAVLLLLPLILSFGVFALHEDAVRGLGRFGLLIIASAILLRGLLLTGNDQLWQDLLAWTLLAAALSSITVLARRMTRMRARLQMQKAELSGALEQIQTLADTDPLTGLLNRGAMTKVLHQRLQRQLPSAQVMTLVLIDLDLFKHINDCYGHRTGDRVLQTFADVVRRSLRKTDFAGRWGGEEFLLLLINANPEQALAAIERLRQPLCKVTTEDPATVLRVTFSAGMAQCANLGDLESAIERADRAMYQAKNNGRDQTAFAPEFEAALLGLAGL